MPPLPHDHIAFQATDEGGVLLDVAAGHVFGLTPAARVAWAAFASGGGLDAAAAAVLERFVTDEATACTGLEHLIADLHGRGLLEMAP